MFYQFTHLGGNLKQRKENHGELLCRTLTPIEAGQLISSSLLFCPSKMTTLLQQMLTKALLPFFCSRRTLLVIVHQACLQNNWYRKCFTEILVTVPDIFFPTKIQECYNRKDSTAYYFLRKRTSLWDKSCKNYVAFNLGNAQYLFNGFQIQKVVFQAQFCF